MLKKSTVLNFQQAQGFVKGEFLAASSSWGGTRRNPEALHPSDCPGAILSDYLDRFELVHLFLTRWQTHLCSLKLRARSLFLCVLSQPRAVFGASESPL